MRMLIRYFFRGVRLVLAPFMLISEKLSTPTSVERSPEEQAKIVHDDGREEWMYESDTINTWLHKQFD